MAYTARILALVTSAVCAGALAIQTTEPAVGQPVVGEPTCPSGRPAFLPPSPPTPLAPLLNETSPLKIPGSYVVVLQPNTSAAIRQAQAFQDRLKAAAPQPARPFTAAILGYAVRFAQQPSVDALDALRRLPCVDYVEADLRGGYSGAAAALRDPPRGLDRIDQRPPTLNRMYDPFQGGTGTDVHAYVIDSGIDTNHPLFTPMRRASPDYVVFCQVTHDANDPRRDCNEQELGDCNGHGTAVAGVIGGIEVGVATGVSLHSVRVSDESCRLLASNMTLGVEWVMKDITDKRRTDSNYRAVVNMSLSVGPGRESSLEEAVAKLIRTAGVTFVASAGNHHLDACSYSPGGGALEAITVGALQTEGRDLIGAVDADSEALFSNFGPCVDLFAPGTAIDTAEARGDPYPGCQTDRSLKPQPRRGTLCAGTSMAAAHVAGCIALYLESAPPDMRTPDQVWKWLEGRAIQKGITSGEVYVERGDRRIFQPRFEFDEPTDISTRHPGTPNLSLYCGR